jgi:hypothetical protein
VCQFGPTELLPFGDEALRCIGAVQVLYEIKWLQDTQQGGLTLDLSGPVWLLHRSR